MRLKIEAVCGKSKARKSVIFGVTEEVADFFIEEIMAKNDGTSSAQVRINISVLHTEQSY